MDLIDLFRYMEWADSAVWRAVSACPSALEDVGTRTQLLHIHAVQRAFLCIWVSRPPEFPELASFPEADAIRRWGLPFYREALQFLTDADDATMDRAIVMPWASELAGQIGREPSAPTLRETAIQLVNHTTHHRAQVAARLRQLGGDPPLSDYIAWIWFGRPSPEWG